MKNIRRVPRLVIACPPPATAVRPWDTGDHLLLLGEIENMPGHVAVASDDGHVHFGYHPEEFREPTEDEL